MEIRIATAKDIDAITRLGNSVCEFQVSDEVVTFWPRDVLIDCIENDSSPILVATENERVIGFIVANYNLSFKKAIIENIFVDPSFRDKAVGKSLLDHLLNRLKQLDCKYVCALTQTENDVAVNFFLNNRFSKGINCVWLDKILDESFKK